VLLFAKDPRRFHLQAMITCARYKGYNKVHIIDKKDFTGDMMANLDGAMKWLKTYIPLRYEISGESLKRKELPEIPYDALREALLNSVIHRDYFERGAVTVVEFYDDRIEMTNPGGLVGGMKLEDLGTRSASRNPLLFDMFHRAGLVERIGSGIMRMRELVKGSGLSPPRFKANGFFSICFDRPECEPMNETINETINETLNETINETIKIILSNISVYSNPKLKVLEAATGFSRAKLTRYIASMKRKGLVEYVGSRKTGHYVLTRKGREFYERQHG
jgi:ATP-dependent DNA helicase RecG